MPAMKQIVPRWFPAIVVMGLIYWFSAQPGEALPVFGWLDAIVKKSGHMLGYGLLALSYWYALALEPKRRWLVWLLAILYAATDEFHQSFVLGRYASVWDVAIFDNLGALVSLWGTNHILSRKRSGENTPYLKDPKGLP
jgi:VanZ family protein